ncbi:uncharacterized protein N7459_005726 [Penicillium hispanicum]|uniref:uncharacterized protein n=1 Tax=Penicillium hispanicum TaxID=1080232 RepID=UPI0025426A03|nr:uncharacterized protein N7459_005726 [Penicillium hispanicum]KAJ5579741.1 hypothetical protein N7459_005726 [Penicillium hispanicum]
MISPKPAVSSSTISLNYESDEASEERPPSPSHPRIHAKFQFARPPPKSSLRLAPKLLLQLQQLAHNRRPVPVLGIWQPPFRKSKLTRGFHQRPKLRTGDIYVTLDEPYIYSRPARTDSTKSDTPEDDACCMHSNDIVAAMCQANGVGETAASTIHLRDARCCWTASAGAAGPGNSNASCYRFAIRNDEDNGNMEYERMILRWEKRSAAGTDDAPAEAEQFVLVLIDRHARRKSRIATMTRSGLDIFVRKASILENLQLCLDLTSPVSTAAGSGRDSYEALESWLYTNVLTMGVWVAQQEGWFH